MSKQTTKTSRTAGILEKIYRVLNEKLFEGKLENVIISIQSTPKSYGHITVSKIWQSGQEMQHEINIGAGTLNRPIEDVVSTLLHECVHLWCMQEGIKDTSRGGVYHNSKFREQAEAHYLKISYDPRIGWSITEPTEALLDLIISEGWTDIMMNRNEGLMIRGGGTPSGGPETVSKTGKGSNSRKYQCPCCKCSVRATREVRILCMSCCVPMVQVN